MPLPSGGVWPPRNLDPVYRQLDTWSTWYEADPDALAGLYGDPSAPRPANRPSTYRGGVIGTVARWFWGAPTTTGERRTKLHVPIASDLATVSADLLYSEPPALVTEDQTTRARLEKLVEEGLHGTLLESGEVSAALGGAYLRVCWDPATAPAPWIGLVHADVAVPEWRWGRLSAVTFWRVVEDNDGRVMRHLERHEPGLIHHGLYEGTLTGLGRPIDLGALPETAALAPTVVTGVPLITAAYIPNMRPNRRWRRVPAGAHLGRSDYDGAEPLMDALDEVYTSWMRDIRLAKARLIVPDTYLQSAGAGRGASFDPDRELYETVSVLGGQDRVEITSTQFAIRVAEHQATAQELTEQILRSAGYSAQTLGLTGEVAVTATEIAARERRSLTTKGRKQVFAGPAIAYIVEVLLAVEAALFNGKTPVERPRVEFADSIAPDQLTLAQTAQLMRTAEAASTETLVRLLHPDWDKPAVDDEVQRIRDESGATTADPAAVVNGIAAADLGTADDEEHEPVVE